MQQSNDPPEMVAERAQARIMRRLRARGWIFTSVDLDGGSEHRLTTEGKEYVEEMKLMFAIARQEQQNSSPAVRS